MATQTEHPSTLTRVRIGVAVAAAGALLAACGSSSKTASSGASTAPSTAPSAATSSKDASSSKAPTNLGGGSFCDKAKAASADVGSAAENIATDTPDKIKAFEQKALDELKSLQGSAPDEIKDPIATLVDAENTLFNDLQAANFDFTKIDSAKITGAFDAPKVTQAVSQIGDYLKSKCGIDPSADVTP